MQPSVGIAGEPATLAEDPGYVPVQAVEQVPDVEPVCVLTLVGAVLGQRGDPVVRSEGDQRAIEPDRLVDELEEAGELGVEAQHVVLHLPAERSEGVADSVGGRKTDGEQVGCIVGAELQRRHRLAADLQGGPVHERGRGDHVAQGAPVAGQLVWELVTEFAQSRFAQVIVRPRSGVQSLGLQQCPGCAGKVR